MSEVERKALLDALEFPKAWIFSALNKRQCEHGVFYSSRDAGCMQCSKSEECEWLSLNDHFNHLESRTLDQLKQSLGEAIDLVGSEAFQYEEHPGDCQCDTCRWINVSMKIAYAATG